MGKLLVTYLCIDLLSSRQGVSFQYIVDKEEEALKQFEEETDGNIEINDIFVEEITDEEAQEFLSKEWLFYRIGGIKYVI